MRLANDANDHEMRSGPIDGRPEGLFCWQSSRTYFPPKYRPERSAQGATTVLPNKMGATAQPPNCFRLLFWFKRFATSSAVTDGDHILLGGKGHRYKFYIRHCYGLEAARLRPIPTGSGRVAGAHIPPFPPSPVRTFGSQKKAQKVPQLTDSSQPLAAPALMSNISPSSTTYSLPLVMTLPLALTEASSPSSRRTR